jgi:hypothetical protein
MMDGWNRGGYGLRERAYTYLKKQSSVGAMC